MTTMAYLNNNFLMILVLICFTLFVKESRGDGHNYKEALTKSILFFEGQRSGKLPTSQRMKWRADSGLSDGHADKVDLSKGYYDAGDNEKFNFPMAFTITMLSWSVIEFDENMGSDLKEAQRAIWWGTKYLLQCASKVESGNKLCAGVGDANVEHQCWQRPEDMDGERPVYWVTSGSDLAGEIAAALAAASIVFEKYKPGYSKKLLNTAEVVMQFGMNNIGKYCDQVNTACPYYCSSGYDDELLWGAAWLYKATKKDLYRNYVVSSAKGETDFFSWDSKLPGFYVLAATENFGDFSNDVDKFMCKILNYPYTTATYTNGGLLMKLADSPLQYATAIGFLITVYAKYTGLNKHSFQCANDNFDSTRLQNQAKAQVDYILGTNPMAMSYMVGYGTRYPQRIHHRGSSLPSKLDHPQEIGCDEGSHYLSTSDPNPNIFIGAVVGGPYADDTFQDERSIYSHLEPATYINAPLVGMLASLI